MTELEELVSQHEALLAEKAALEDQLQLQSDSEQTAGAHLKKLEEDNASLQRALADSRNNAQQVTLSSLQMQSLFIFAVLFPAQATGLQTSLLCHATMILVFERGVAA